MKTFVTISSPIFKWKDSVGLIDVKAEVKPPPPPDIPDQPRLILKNSIPLQYTLTPLIGAIAAGNVALVKTSPKCPRTTELMTRLFPKYLDPSAFAVIAGDAQVIVVIRARICLCLFKFGKGAIIYNIYIRI